MPEQSHGCLLINKPAGISSFGVIQQLQRALIKKSTLSGTPLRKSHLPKMGHGGTLDPFATGLLVVCVGDGTKLSQYFLGSVKTYQGRMRFGSKTASADPTTPIIETCSQLPATLDEIQTEASRFTETTYLQTPPMYSAKKIEGKRLYTLARQGLETARSPHESQIFEFKILTWSSPYAEYRVQCSAGTYIRTLACDLALRLNSLAFLETLDRVASGTFNINCSETLDSVCSKIESQQELHHLKSFVPFQQMLSIFPTITISANESIQIRQGQKKTITDFESTEITLRLGSCPDLKKQLPRTIKLVTENTNKTVALFSYQVDLKNWKLDRVFPLKA